MTNTIQPSDDSTPKAPSLSDMITGRQIREDYLAVTEQEFWMLKRLGLFPKADSRIGPTLLWLKSTVEEWAKTPVGKLIPPAHDKSSKPTTTTSESNEAASD